MAKKIAIILIAIGIFCFIGCSVFESSIDIPPMSVDVPRYIEAFYRIGYINSLYPHLFSLTMFGSTIPLSMGISILIIRRLRAKLTESGTNSKKQAIEMIDEELGDES